MLRIEMRGLPSETCLRHFTALSNDILWRVEVGLRKAADAAETLLRFEVNYGGGPSNKLQNVVCDLIHLFQFSCDM